MRFLIDQDVYALTTRCLRDLGHEVKSALSATRSGKAVPWGKRWARLYVADKQAVRENSKNQTGQKPEKMASSTRSLSLILPTAAFLLTLFSFASPSRLNRS